MAPNEALQDVKAVVFDTFGTITDWRGSVTFDLELHPSGSPEDWQVKTRLHCEFG